MARRNDFTKGSIPLSILKMAEPMTVAQLINVLYNVVDRVYIGQIPKTGTMALTGLGLTFPIITIVIAFANLVGMGGAPLLSIERGREHDEMAETILGNSFVMLVFFGVVLTIIGLIIKRPVLYLFGASAHTIGYADSYLTIYLLGNIFVVLGLGLNSFINAQGFAKIGMLSVAIGAIINIVLDPLFIYVFHMGVSGAALATIISQFVSFLWIIRFLTGKNTIVRLKKDAMHLDFPLMGKILGLGMAGFVMSVTSSTVQIVCNATLSLYGGDLYVGVMTVLNSIRDIVQMPVQGITNGGQPIISYNYGAKENKRVLKGIYFETATCLGYTFFAWALVHFFGIYFIHIFNQEATLVQAAVPALAAYFFGYFMMSFQFAGQSTFVALGKSKQAIFFSIFRKVIIVVPLTILLPQMGFGVMGVFYAEPISNFIGGTASYLTMWLTVGRKLKNAKES